jgi:capsular exopolysaccharide synthesis family protein
MSKFFKALEQAERDHAQQEPSSAAPPAAQRTATVPQWPAPADEQPPVFTPPRPVPEASRPVREGSRPAPEPSRVAPALLDEHLVSLQAPSTPAAEQYRVLRHLVETLRKRASLQVLAVTSGGVGDGKTVTTINLAGALAQSEDARVLLVDLDLRRPSVARYLALGHARPTLADVLGTPGIALEDAVVRLPRFNLSVLRAPVSAAAPYELLRSPRLEALLTEARAQYDYVVVDTPPFVPFPDCRLIAKCIDGFVLVVACNRTPRGVLAEALKAMDADKAVGYVFNAHPSRPAPYYANGHGRSRVLPWHRKGEHV